MAKSRTELMKGTLDCRRVDRIGREAPRQVVSAHRDRPAPPHHREGHLASRRPCNESGTGMKRQRDRDLDDELQAFVDDLTARNVARGMSPEQARRTALVETGGVQQVRELTREVWFASSLETLGRDIRYGARLLLRSPGFACVVVLT